MSNLQPVLHCSYRNVDICLSERNTTKKEIFYFILNIILHHSHSHCTFSCANFCKRLIRFNSLFSTLYSGVSTLSLHVAVMSLPSVLSLQAQSSIMESVCIPTLLTTIFL